MRVVAGNAHAGVEDHNALQRGAEREYAVGLVVLFLLTDKENLHLGILYHILDLLLRTRGVEGNGDHLDAIGAEVGVKIMNAVLRENGYLVLGLQAEVEHGIAHLFHTQRKLVPINGKPLQATEIAEC